MKLVITTGKTGGHVFPALAVARALAAEDPASGLCFIGTRKGLDSVLIRPEGFEFKAIFGCGLPKRLSPKTVIWAVSLMIAVCQVWRIYRKDRPDVVLSFGGFISCAPVLVARWMGIPVVIHEANARLGRANRFLARHAKAVCTSFPVKWLEGFVPVHVTGLPVREGFSSLGREKCLQTLGLENTRLVILVMGGSLGSRRINDCILDALRELQEWSKFIQVIHVTGKADHSRVLKEHRPNGIRYFPYPFLEKIECAFGCADLFIGRAGASTLAELTCCGVASLLVPYPYAIEDHQYENASFLAREGAAMVIEENHLTGRVLAREMSKLIGNERLRASMAESAKRLGISDGALKILKVVRQCLQQAP